MCPTVSAHWRHLANTIEHVLPLAHLSPQSKRKSIGSAVLHSSQQKVPILYNGRLFPQKFPLPMGDLEPHLTHDSLGTSEPTTHMAFRLVFSRFCTDDRRVSLYFTMERSSPSKLPLPRGTWTPI